MSDVEALALLAQRYGWKLIPAFNDRFEPIAPNWWNAAETETQNPLTNAAQALELIERERLCIRGDNDPIVDPWQVGYINNDDREIWFESQTDLKTAIVHAVALKQQQDKP